MSDKAPGARPLPCPEEEAVRGFFDRLAPTWDETTRVDPAKLRRIVAEAGLAPGDAVLDVGSGTGVLLPFLAEAVGPTGHVYELDLSPAMLERAREKARATGVDAKAGSVSYLCAGVDHIPLPDASCQAVVCFSAFPHFPDQKAAVAEMARVLAPGGRLVVAHAESREAINSFHAGVDGPVSSHRLPEDGLMLAYARAAGLEDITLTDGQEGYLLRAVRAAAR